MRSRALFLLFEHPQFAVVGRTQPPLPPLHPVWATDSGIIGWRAREKEEDDTIKSPVILLIVTSLRLPILIPMSYS